MLEHVATVSSASCSCLVERLERLDHDPELVEQLSDALGDLAERKREATPD